ncbi:MAG: GDSL-type esterase/lipase family protein [Patescibacteria group bacterium]
MPKGREQLQSCADKAPNILAFGDSLVSGYGVPEGDDAVSALSLKLGVPVANFGVSGDTSAEALKRINTILERQPDIVIVLLGGNDALQQLPVAETERNISEILKKLQQAGIRPVLGGVLGGFPTDPYASMFARLASEHEVSLVPNVLSGLIGTNEYMSDPIHPNTSGYARIADKLYPKVQEACLEL